MLTDKEKRLIIGLRKNGREKINCLAKKYKYPNSTMSDLLHKMEERGVIEHKNKVAFEKIGFPVRMFVILKTNYEKRDQLQNYLTMCKNVNSVHLIDSGFDFHVEGVFKNQKEAQDFLDELEIKNSILQKQVYSVMDTIYHEQFLTKEEHFE
jgi:DNA-binding Lrp family transcriptional regulator